MVLEQKQQIALVIGWVIWPLLSKSFQFVETLRNLIRQLLYKASRKKRTLLVFTALTTLLILSAISIYVILASLVDDVMEDDKHYGFRLGNHSIYYRKDWGGSPARRKYEMPHPVGLVVISHSLSPTCNSFHSCASNMRHLQHRHFNRDQDDIAYNFFIGGEGNIYVGRGWDILSEHPQMCIGITFIGNFNIDDLNDTMIDAAKELIQQGVALNKLRGDYFVVGHNQSSRDFPLSPGENVYSEISTWPHFSDMIVYQSILLRILLRLKLEIIKLMTSIN